jgi:hypothetical protein
MWESFSKIVEKTNLGEGLNKIKTLAQVRARFKGRETG